MLGRDSHVVWIDQPEDGPEIEDKNNVAGRKFATAYRIYRRFDIALVFSDIFSKPGIWLAQHDLPFTMVGVVMHNARASHVRYQDSTARCVSYSLHITQACANNR